MSYGKDSLMHRIKAHLMLYVFHLEPVRLSWLLRSQKRSVGVSISIWLSQANIHFRNSPFMGGSGIICEGSLS